MEIIGVGKVVSQKDVCLRQQSQKKYFITEYIKM